MLNLITRLGQSQLGLESIRMLHTTGAVSAGSRYRESKKQERHIGQLRVLADTPDWSYLDGRPAPLNEGQKERYVQQVEFNRRIQNLLCQIDNARMTVAAEKEKNENDKMRIISTKLKSKEKIWNPKRN